MPTTAWRFPGTEGADGAVLRLKELDSKDLINLLDIAVLRWPEYASQPMTLEHVHEQGSKVSHMVRRLQHPVIDGSMLQSVQGDLRPGTSAVVLLSSEGNVEAIVRAFEGQPMELIGPGRPSGYRGWTADQSAAMSMTVHLRWAAAARIWLVPLPRIGSRS
jgi:uncharacterized membrane protein